MRSERALSDGPMARLAAESSSLSIGGGENDDNIVGRSSLVQAGVRSSTAAGGSSSTPESTLGRTGRALTVVDRRPVLREQHKSQECSNKVQKNSLL